MVEAIFCRTLNYSLFETWRLIGFEVEMLVNVGGFPLNFSDQYCPFLDDQNTQKKSYIVKFCFRSKLNRRYYIVAIQDIP